MTFDSAMVNSIVALIAVIVGPLVTIHVARKNINSSVISKNRQEWINRLRNEIAELLKEIQYAPSAYSADVINLQQAIERHGLILSKIEIIRLLINPKEPDHADLVCKIKLASDKVIDSINEKKGNAKDLEAVASNIVTLSQLILKREWERVKAGN